MKVRLIKTLQEGTAYKRISVVGRVLIAPPGYYYFIGSNCTESLTIQKVSKSKFQHWKSHVQDWV